MLRTARTQKRILLMGETVTLSHFVRPYVLSEALHAAGYSVRMAADPRYKALLPEQVPFEILPLQSRPPEAFLDSIATGAPLFDVPTLDRYVQEDMALLHRFAPHVVVGDMRQSLAVSSRRYGIPYVNIINASWSPYAPTEFELVEHPMMALLGEPLTQAMFKAMRPLGDGFHVLPLNTVRMQYGLPPIAADMKEVYCYGDYTLYPDVPELIPTRPLPPNHRYIGPVLWSPHMALPDWWATLPDDKPIVYVNLGSSGNARLLEPLLHALADLPVTLIAATAERATIEHPPAGVYLADYLPGSAAAERADLVICNGGTLSVHQALAAGVPFLGIIHNMDQWIWAKTAQNSGAGIALRERDADAMQVKAHVQSMLAQPSYGHAAREMMYAFQRVDVAQNIVAFMDEITQIQ